MKKVTIFKKIALVFALAYLPLTVTAWGVTGHRVVGQIADFYLQAKARKAVQQILGTESMAIASNWADFAKSDTTYKHMDSWHYVNFPPDLAKSDVFTFLEKQPAANVYNKTLEMIAVLKNKNSSAAQKKLALRLIIHFIGDLHQPMHTARKEDLGGNKVLVTWFGEKSNLHRVWDDGLISFQQLSFTEYAKVINYPSPKQLVNWQKTNLKDWVYESYQVCNKIYARGIKTDDKLSFKYNYDWIDTVNEQLLKGGIHLAKVLNDIYK